MDIAREFLLGFIKIHLLYHANKESFCGIDMMAELKRHGYSMGPSTIYPILHKLEENGYLKSEKRNENGKIRIYYKATPKGKLALKHIKPKIDELVSEITEK